MNGECPYLGSKAIRKMSVAEVFEKTSCAKGEWVSIHTCLVLTTVAGGTTWRVCGGTDEREGKRGGRGAEKADSEDKYERLSGECVPRVHARNDLR